MSIVCILIENKKGRPTLDKGIMGIEFAVSLSSEEMSGY